MNRKSDILHVSYEGEVAIDLIVQHISEYLKQKPADKSQLYPGLSTPIPSSPHRAGKSGRPH
ncbi:hypothetical protein KGM_208831 [Danaus plexippus plexippus]|uniref:Uncharacterized protein n=1 Tax=Danaus plexippus plexippus TaxID=278856 RepID=A0A212F8Q2_DANPL|nr:hypothetical protein KGM_208831 [Danaus plexippus plexippus]